MARKRAKPRHLGASSPSGNVRGECRGWTAFRSWTKNSRMEEAQYRVWIFCFLSAPNFAKTKRGANGKFLPKPLLFHLRHLNSKTNEPKFWQILSPKKCFAKTSSALFRHLPEYLEGRTPKEKHPFLFQKKFHPRQIRNVRSVFLSGLPKLCEAVAERYERTRQFQVTTRSARAISRSQDYQQNAFELCLIHTALT